MNKYKWLNKDSRDFLKRGYLQATETAEQRGHDIAVAAEKYLNVKGFAEKFEGYLAQGFYSLSSPIWANFGRERGLPISCNGVFIEDRMDAILEKQAEVGMQTKHGAGTSAYFGELRKRGGEISAGGTSSGPVHFMELFDKVSSVVSQSNVRRGSFAAYLPIEHPDINEFLRIRSEGNSIQEMSFGVCITDEWMRSLIGGDRKKRLVWASIVKKRFETGYPYLFFTDTANKNAPEAYKRKKLKISASNLCSEIFLHSSEDESFVCCLSSLNLAKWNEIRDTDAIETLVYFLDAVMEEYIEKTKEIPFMQSSHNFAKKQRALGVGVLGWHSFLQEQMMAFETMEAQFLNMEIHKIIKEKSEQATKELAVLLGEPEHLRGYEKRNMTTMAIAPTTSSSFILGQVSPSIEPLNSNYFTKDLAKGKFTYKNPHLERLLEKKKKNTQTAWKSILQKGGSVQHLDFLTQQEKDVFKTFGEISQKEIVIQAAQRQKYIDQGQSLNLMISPKCPPKQVSELLIFGWEQGIKSFYYQRSANPSQELARSILSCSACEG
jgi:ribonucleoside-diphosphate reductase alpha chain|tara:strand:- start:21013 stop:22659 length:1647 start_codon:yes stop_codon:yes gene_type:complete